MPLEWYERNPKDPMYKKGATQYKQNKGRLTADERETATAILNKAQGDRRSGRDDVYSPTQAVNALSLYESQPKGVATAGGDGGSSAADIAKAQAEGWTWNGVPVIETNGRLVYDIDKIGANLGMSQDEINHAKAVSFGVRNVSTGDYLEGLVESGGQMTGNPAEKRADDVWNAAADSLSSDNQRFINNLAQLNPTQANLDYNNKDHLTNLYKPGYMSDVRGASQRDQLDQGQGPSGIGKYARYAVPAAAALVIGAGALGAAGALGSGSTLASGAGGIGAAGGQFGASGLGAMSTTGNALATGATAAGGIGGATTFPAAGAGNALATGAAGSVAGAGGSMAAGGIPWDAIITAGSTVAGGAINYFGADAAADAGVDAAEKAAEVQWQMYQQGREDLAPWREAGANALTDLTGKIAAGPGEFTESPGYQFTLDEGLKAQQNALSAMGQNRSGKHIKSATQYAENMASTEYDNFLRRWYQSLTPYQSLAGIGQTSAGQTASMGVNTGQGVAQSNIYGGQAAGAGDINKANALTGAITGGANQLLYYNSLRNLNPAMTGYSPFTSGNPNLTGRPVDQWQYSQSR